MKNIILTGGGTAGHVTPNLALRPALEKEGYKVSYIGSYKGMEKDLVEKAGIPYYGISSGKLRRYFDWKNFTDPFRVIKGYFEAKKLIKKLKPDAVFSKGGFVAVPVVIAASRAKIPVIAHESDLTPGLANKISLRFCDKICCNFPETIPYLPADQAILTGCPIREELFTGDKEEGYRMTGFTPDKPVLLIMGGSLGSVKVNEAVRAILPELLKQFQIIHLCGKGNLAEALEGTAGYVQYEYISDPLKHLLALCDIVISRAGANAICEFVALQKPALLIPLSAAASRGDQILNAKSFKKQGFCEMLEEEDLTNESLYENIQKVFQNKDQYVAAMIASNQTNAVDRIVTLIKELR